MNAVRYGAVRYKARFERIKQTEKEKEVYLSTSVGNKNREKKSVSMLFS